MSNIILALLLMFTGFRLLTFFLFKPDGLSFVDCLKAFRLGLQYDLRWVSILVLPIVLVSIYRQFTPFYSIRTKKVWSHYLVTIWFVSFFFYIADLVNFSYNKTRLDAGAMNFVEDPGISLQMIWQTYPLLWMLIGLGVAILVFRWVLNKSYWYVSSNTDGKGIAHRKRSFLIVTMLLLLFIYGNIAGTPLTWKDAFCFKDSFKTYLALNPIQNFVATMRLRKPAYNEDKARQVFPVIANFLQLPDNDVFSFKRTIQPRSGSIGTSPNIVLVQCESFSMYKSTMSGNPLNTTPYFNDLSKQGIFFERCFTPHFSTARGLFAIVTGIPDVQLFKFSTRNPAAINQNTIINQFSGYSKHYFLGGNPEFNNFEGLLNNIDSLQVHTEENIAAPKVNVWGVSDKDLFLTANDVFKKEKRPFFAIVQTSSNHRPYNIPELDVDFRKDTVDEDRLKQYGFESLDEYNIFRYADYSVQSFMEAARKEAYFDNTIFVFIGDHGVAGNATAVYPMAWTTHRLSDEHVPFLIYAPKLLPPKLHSEVVSQIDVLPTIAGLLNKPYTNTTLGRDVLDPFKKNDIAFITNTAGKIGVVNNDYYYIKSLEFQDQQLVPVRSSVFSYTLKQEQAIQQKLDTLTDAYYQTALYLLLNNKRH